MTDLVRCASEAFEGLPAEPRALCRVVQGLLVHEEWAPVYDLDLDDERRQEVRTRPAVSMVEAILQLDPAPLVETRPPERRLVANCRHFSTLSTALLRSVGIPARARCGFASYFEADRMVDHWVTEYVAVDSCQWVRTDSQLDDLQREIVKPSFDPYDMPAGPFVPAGEAWAACRQGFDDPVRFGIFDMSGLWFICSNVIRDLAALNKMELLPWDSWGPMAFQQDPDPEKATLIDSIASVIAEGNIADIRLAYDRNELVQVPSTVFDGRFGEIHDLHADGGL
jgi:hypothetical protein